MTHRSATALHRAHQHGARALVALMAGMAVTAAWSSQMAGGSIGKVVNSGSTSTPAPVPAPSPSPAPAPSGTGKSASRAASTASR